jgi:hypothetical protein
MRCAVRFMRGSSPPGCLLAICDEQETWTEGAGQSLSAARTARCKIIVFHCFRRDLRTARRMIFTYGGRS